MDLDEALRTTSAVREFTDTPVADDVVTAILDTARFAPNGGNRQAWRVILVKDGDHRLSRPQDIARIIAAVSEMG